MSIRVFGSNANSLQFAEVSAIKTRADGTTEDLGVLDRYEAMGHRMRRWGKRVLPWLMVALLGAMGGGGLGATVIVNGGQAIVTNLVSGLGGTVPKFVAWGTGAGTAAASDTTLFTESSEEARTSGTVSRVTTTVTNDTYQVVGTITVATSNKTITNVGLFDASTSGNLYFKSDFTGLALNVGDSITFTIKVKFS